MAYVPKNSNPASMGGFVVFPLELGPAREPSVEHDKFSDFLAGREDLAAAQSQAGCSVSAAEFVTSAFEAAVRAGLLPQDASVSDSKVRRIVHAGFGDNEAVLDRLAGLTTEEAFDRYGKGICALLICYLEPPEEPIRLADFLDVAPEE